jgi:hypothetical protein
MSGFTPGPWEISESAYVCRQAIVARTPEGDLDPIAEVMGSGKGQNLANARLIAAAPDLIAALKSVEWVMGAGPRFCADCGRDRSVGHYKGCRLAAALAKAEGR